MKKAITLFFLLACVVLVSGESTIAGKLKKSVHKIADSKTTAQKDIFKRAERIAVLKKIAKDTLVAVKIKWKLHKKNATASYYAEKFHGKKTASGVTFDMHKYTAAHKKFPFGTKLKVTNERNGRFVIVEVNDRGPFVRSREIDLSKNAFLKIAKNKGVGIMPVTIEILRD